MRSGGKGEVESVRDAMKTALECCGGNKFRSRDGRCHTGYLRGENRIEAREERREARKSVEWPTFRAGGVCDEGQKPG